MRLPISKRLVITFAWAAWLCASAIRAGEVWTTDGRVLEGLVKLDARGDFQLSAPNGSLTRLKADEAVFAWFGSMRGLGMFSPPPPVRPASVGDSPTPTIALADGVYSLRGGGTGLRGAADSCGLFVQDAVDNVEVIAQVTEITPETGRIGITIRQSDEPGVPHATLMVNAAGDLTFTYRTESGKPSTEVSAGKVKLPTTLRMVRQGRQVTWYKQRNERDWQPGGQVFTEKLMDQWLTSRQGAEPGLAMPSAATAGLLLVSGGPGEAAAAVESLVIRDLPANVMPVPQDETDNWIRSRVEGTSPGLWLRSGTFLASATLTSLDDRNIGFTDASGVTGSTGIQNVSRVNLTSLPPSLASSIPEEGSGVLLSSGEFIEGQFSQWKERSVTLSSVIFGISSFKTPDEARAMVWHGAPTLSSRWTLWLRDGSIIAADSVRAEGADLSLQEPLLGVRRVPAREVYAMRAGGERVVPLASLRPQKSVTRSWQRQFIEGSCFDARVGSLMAAGARGAVGGIAAPWVTDITYEIPAGSTRFVCWAGVPDRISGFSQDLKPMVLLDGAKALQLAMPKSKDPRAMPMTLPVAGKKTLTLRTDGDPKNREGFILWADGLFVR